MLFTKFGPPQFMYSLRLFLLLSLVLERLFVQLLVLAAVVVVDVVVVVVSGGAVT